jgi:hypothetical protein
VIRFFGITFAPPDFTTTIGLGARPVLALGPPFDLGVALADGLRERFSSVDPASPPEYRRGHEAGAPTTCVDDACVLDPEAGRPESGAELGRCNRLLVSTATMCESAVKSWLVG